MTIDILKTQTTTNVDSAPHVIVIGAGFGGMAAALRMRAKGYQVTLIDRASKVGGRAQVFERDGFCHDAGPTVITAPFLFDEIFELFSKKREDYVKFVPLKPWYRFQYPDGSTFDYGGTLEETIDEIKRIEPDDVAGYFRLLEHSKRLYDVGFNGLADQPFHSFFLMFQQIPTLMKLGSYRTVWGMISRYIKNDKLRQAFSIQPLLLGGSPFNTTSIYGLIHYLEREWGVYFAMGGTGAIAEAMKRLMTETGVSIRLNTTVTSIQCHAGQVQGVQLSTGETLKSNIIVSNADPMYLYNNLLDKKHQKFNAKLKTRFMRLSMGLFVLYFGTKRKYDNIAHHTIWLGARYKGLLDDIFKRKILADDFSLYVHRPTATDPSFAPEGCDSFYVLCPVPNLQADINWEIEGPKLQDRIVTALEKTMLPELKQHITADFYMTPQDFSDDYLSVDGAGFSVAPYFSQSAWFRFHNKSEGPKGLYLVGAGTHPGAGVPGVLSSAKVVDRLIPHSEEFVQTKRAS